METNKDWFERQKDIFKRKAEDDFKEWKKNEEEMWNAYLDRLRTGQPINCDDGILPMITHEDINLLPGNPERIRVENGTWIKGIDISDPRKMPDKSDSSKHNPEEGQ